MTCEGSEGVVGGLSANLPTIGHNIGSKRVLQVNSELLNGPTALDRKRNFRTGGLEKRRFVTSPN